MGTLFTFVFLVALVACIVFFKKSGKEKKQGLDNAKSKKTALIALAVAVVSFIIVGLSGSGESKPADTSTATETTSEQVETTPAEPEATAQEAIEIVAGEMGEYGQERTLNAGTDTEDTIIAHFVPAGTYDVTNTGSNTTQVNVYKDEVVKTDAGWEEWADVGGVVLIDAGETKSITVDEGYFVNVDAPASISLVKTN